MENTDWHSIVANNMSPHELQWQTASTLHWWKHWLIQFCLCFTYGTKIFCIDFLVEEERIYWQRWISNIIGRHLWKHLKWKTFEKINKCTNKIVEELSENTVKSNNDEIVSWIPRGADKYLKCGAALPKLVCAYAVWVVGPHLFPFPRTAYILWTLIFWGTTN